MDLTGDKLTALADTANLEIFTSEAPDAKLTLGVRDNKSSK